VYFLNKQINIKRGGFLRVRMSFKISNFPLAHRLLILSYLKQAIRLQSESFYQSFFIEKERQTKSYTFASYFPKIQIIGDEIISDFMQVIVSSSNVEFMIYLINSCQQTKKFTYKNTVMSLERFELLKEHDINESKILFKTLSPVLVESKEGKPLLAGDDNFEKELNIIASKKVQTIEGRDLYQPLKLLNYELHKTVIKEYFHQENHDYLFYTANTGKILIEGDSRDLKFFYQNGIGLRNGVGFGCLDIL
jgi:CRISPR-associated endoribonuclease Cas6